jgi:hypothetical protein
VTRIEQHQVEQDRQHDDRPPVVAEESEQPFQRAQQRHDHPGKHAEVDRAHQLRIRGPQQVELLGPDVQPEIARRLLQTVGA